MPQKVKLSVAFKSGSVLDFDAVNEKEAEKLTRTFEMYTRAEGYESKKFQLDAMSGDSRHRYIVLHMASVEAIYVETIHEDR
jgi:Holliday junction resolvase-like predicted endonuclease